MPPGQDRSRALLSTLEKVYVTLLEVVGFITNRTSCPAVNSTSSQNTTITPPELMALIAVVLRNTLFAESYNIRSTSRSVEPDSILNCAPLTLHANGTVITLPTSSGVVLVEIVAVIVAVLIGVRLLHGIDPSSYSTLTAAPTRRLGVMNDPV